MRALAVSRTARLAAGGVLGLILVVGAMASHTSHGMVRAAPVVRPASLAPYGAVRPLSARAAVTAALDCAAPAAAAGWADNGSFGGDLVTAVAVCMAESGGQPRVYYCEGTGKDGTYPPAACRAGTYDRGLFQLNSKYQPQVTDVCAFSAQCNADAAYAISADGTSFAPWATYTAHVYARYLPQAQAAVTGLAQGAVASAVFGACLATAGHGAGAAVVVGRCGGGGRAEQWTVTADGVTGGVTRGGVTGGEVTGGEVTQAGLCLTAGGGAVTVSACNDSPAQIWTATPGHVRDSHGDCLADPATSVTPGTALAVAPCSGGTGQTWWLP